MSDPKRLVAAGYDAMAVRFDQWQSEVSGSPHMRYLDQLVALLPRRPDVLELGCGAAVESTRILAERANVTGVDISEAQIALARKRLPQATFISADVSALTLAPESFDAVVAFYVLHIPREDLDALLGRVANWLRPGGLFLANTSFAAEAKSSSSGSACPCSSAAPTPPPTERGSPTPASSSSRTRLSPNRTRRASCLPLAARSEASCLRCRPGSGDLASPWVGRCTSAWHGRSRAT